MAPKLPHPGPLLKAARKRRDLTLEAVAEATGLTAATISRIETEKYRGSPESLERLAEYFGMTPGDLMRGEDHESTPASGDGGGPLRTYELTTVFDGAAVRGPDALLADHDPDSPYSDLRKAMALSHLHRAGEPNHRRVELAGIPAGSILIDCQAALEVRVAGATVERYPAGVVLVADPARRPSAEDLVLALHAPDLSDPEQAEVFAEIRRFEAGPRGVGMLFELSRDQAVTEGGAWRIVATITEARKPRKPTA